MYWDASSPCQPLTERGERTWQPAYGVRGGTLALPVWIHQSWIRKTEVGRGGGLAFMHMWLMCSLSCTMAAKISCWFIIFLICYLDVIHLCFLSHLTQRGFNHEEMLRQDYNTIWWGVIKRHSLTPHTSKWIYLLTSKAKPLFHNVQRHKAYK